MNLKLILSSIYIAVSLVCFAQISDSVVVKRYDLFSDYRRPEGIKEMPAFYAYGYAFYPEKKLVGQTGYWIHPLSSSGIGTYYIDTLKNVDYNSFEFVNPKRGIAKDKNHIINGFGYIGFLPDEVRYVFGQNKNENLRFIHGDTIYNFATSPVSKYHFDEIVNESVFKRNDSLYIFGGDFWGTRCFAYPENTFHDIRQLKRIDGQLYQDDKNLYWLYEGQVKTISDEQIIGKHIFAINNEGQRGITESNNYFWIGIKNLYYPSGKVFNYYLQSYQFFGDSYYYYYNGYLYFFQGNTTSSSSYPLGTNGRLILDFSIFKEGLNDEETVQRDFRKVKFLGRDMMLYDNKELFFEDKKIAYPVDMNIDKLEYVGRFPYRLYVKLEPVDKSQRSDYNTPILRYDGLLFIICNNRLEPLKSVKDEYGYFDKNFDLANLKFLNEYYFTDGKTLYANQEISANIIRNWHNKKRKSKSNWSYLTSNDVDINNATVYNRYFVVDNKIYYNYQPINKHQDTQILFPLRWSSSFGIVNDKSPNPKDLDLSFINFDKLKIIPGTEYLTDENYLIYKNNVVGKIDYNTLIIRSSDFLEDSLRYFCNNLYIEKEKLRINLFKSED